MVVRSCVLLAFCLCAAAHAAEIGQSSLRELRLDKFDQPAPDFSIGDGRMLSDCRGQWVLLHFWATWCKPCVRELPQLNRLYLRWRDDPVTFLTVSIEYENRDEVFAFARRLGLQLPVLLANEIGITDRYWNWGLPVTYVINPEGMIVARALGPREWDSGAADALMASLAR